MGIVRLILLSGLFVAWVVPLVSVEATEQSLKTENLELGCGISDDVYTYLVAELPERAKLNLPLRSKGSESGRRLYMFSDNSWFLTLEFLSAQSVAEDISCVVAKGTQKDIESAFEVEVREYPEWHWGKKPTEWP